MRLNLSKNRNGQVWVETVIYTLIGLSLIGLVLGMLTPKIREYRDRTVIEQSIHSLEVIDSKLSEVLDAPGNKRKVYLSIERGTFTVDPRANKVSFTIPDSHVPYSEIGVPVQVGRIQVTTTQATQLYSISLSLLYPKYNLTIIGGSETKNLSLGLAAIPHNVFIENLGYTNSNVTIDFSSN